MCIEQVDTYALLQVRLWGVGAGKDSRVTLMQGSTHSVPRALNEGGSPSASTVELGLQMGR